ncbi:MAG: hypothetical protein ACFNJM_01820 [Selenomonas artemidis]
MRGLASATTAVVPTKLHVITPKSAAAIIFLTFFFVMVLTPIQGFSKGSRLFAPIDPVYMDKYTGAVLERLVRGVIIQL